MTLKECFESFGGDYDGVLGRLKREALVEKFVVKFLDDKSFALFESSMKNGDCAEALRAVHTLKGICQNLSFTKLYESSSLATQALKENNMQKAAALLPQVSEDYRRIIDAVGKYKCCGGDAFYGQR